MISRMPKADEGPGSFTGGDAHKYMDLVREWQLGRQESQCDAARGTLTRYAERHHRVLSSLHHPADRVQSLTITLCVRRSRERYRRVMRNSHVRQAMTAAALQTA